VPIALSIFAVYVIVGVSRLLGKVPYLGPRLSSRVRHVLAVVVIAAVIIEAGYLVIASKDVIVGFAPKLQKLLVGTIEWLAAHIPIEPESTWSTLRGELVSQIDVQKLIGRTFASVFSTIASIELVLFYTFFILWERRLLVRKVASLTSSRAKFARIREVFETVNAQIGSYLALKAVLGIFLGAACWIPMALVGLEFAAFWAVLIALLHLVPYIGAVVGIALPVAMAIVQFAATAEVLAVLLPLVLIHVLAEYVIESHLMGKALNLGPLAILGSLTIWSELWGVPGVFLAIPIAGIMTLVLAQFDSTRPIAVFLSRNGQV
jgi:predicted PurR-regulated permease PerM